MCRHIEANKYVVLSLSRRFEQVNDDFDQSDERVPVKVPLHVIFALLVSYIFCKKLNYYGNYNILALQSNVVILVLYKNNIQQNSVIYN